MFSFSEFTADCNLKLPGKISWAEKLEIMGEGSRETYKTLRYFFSMKFFLLVILLLLLLLAGMGCTLGEETDPVREETEETGFEEEQPDEEMLEEPGQAVRSGRLTLYSDDGTTRWLVASEEAVRHQEGEDVTFEPVAAEVFLQQDREEPDYVIEGEFGRYHIEPGTLEFPGTSRIKADEYRFTSRDIVWQQRENLISSREHTEIAGPGFTARGGGFSAPAELDSFTIYRGEDEPARIRWKEGDFSDEEF